MTRKGYTRHIAIAGIVALTTWLLVTVSVDNSVSAAAPNPVAQCVATYTTADTSLHKGQARVTRSGLVAVGGQGLTVGRTSSEPDALAGSASVVAADDSDTKALTKAYVAQGRSVLDDARAAGLSEDFIGKLCEDALAGGTFDATATAKRVAKRGGHIFDSICVTDDSGRVQWEGCSTRYRVDNDGDPNWVYGIDDAQASGHETNWEPWLDLHTGGARNEYHTPHLDIIKASPGSDLNDQTRCSSSSFGLTVAGFGASSGGTVCPERWDITKSSILSNPEIHKTEWKGETNGDREAVVMSGYKLKNAKSSGYEFWINWDVH